MELVDYQLEIGVWPERIIGRPKIKIAQKPGGGCFAIPDL